MFNLDSALGIEIQEKKLVFASIKKGLREVTIQRLLVIDDFRALPAADLSGRVQAFLRSNGFSSENVIVGVPRSEVIVRYARLPLDAEENLEQVVKFQVEKFEPTEEERSVFDYSVVSRSESEKQIVLLIVLMRQKLLDEYLQVCSDFGLRPAAVRFSTLGIQGALSLLKDMRPKRSSTLTVRLGEGRIEFLLTSARGELHSEAVAVPIDSLGIDLILAELDQFVSRLELSGDEEANVYVFGELLERFREDLEKRLPGCRFLDSDARLRLGGTTKGQLSVALTAIGLAVSGVSKFTASRLNLIPPERRVGGGRPTLVPTYVLALLLLFSVGALAARGFLQEHALLEQVDTQLQSLEKQVNEAFALRSQVEAGQGELAELKEVLKEREAALLVVRDLTERIPDNTYLQNLQIEGEQVTMQGYSDEASSILPLLVDSPYLEAVKTNWITQDPRMAGKERFSFGATIKSK